MAMVTVTPLLKFCYSIFCRFVKLGIPLILDGKCLWMVYYQIRNTVDIMGR